MKIIKAEHSMNEETFAPLIKFEAEIPLESVISGVSQHVSTEHFHAALGRELVNQIKQELGLV